MHMQGVIIKESKDSLDLLIEMEENSQGDTQADKEAREKI